MQILADALLLLKLSLKMLFHLTNIQGQSNEKTGAALKADPSWIPISVSKIGGGLRCTGRILQQSPPSFHEQRHLDQLVNALLQNVTLGLQSFMSGAGLGGFLFFPSMQCWNSLRVEGDYLTFIFPGCASSLRE